MISLGGGANGQREVLEERARILAAGIRYDAGYRWALDLAGMVQEIAQYGEHERQACQVMIGGFANYLRVRTAQTRSPGGAL